MKNLKQMAIELHEEAKRHGLFISRIEFDREITGGLSTWSGDHRIDTVRIDAEMIDIEDKEQAE